VCGTPLVDYCQDAFNGSYPLGEQPQDGGYNYDPAREIFICPASTNRAGECICPGQGATDAVIDNQCSQASSSSSSGGSGSRSGGGSGGSGSKGNTGFGRFLGNDHTGDILPGADKGNGNTTTTTGGFGGFNKQPETQGSGVYDPDLVEKRFALVRVVDWLKGVASKLQRHNANAADELYVDTSEWPYGFEFTPAARGPVNSGSACSDGSYNLSLSNQMACFSSGNPDPELGIDYAYTANTAEEINAVYDSIIDAIVGVSVSFTSGRQSIAAQVNEGTNVPIPFPRDFVCDPNAEQPFTLRTSFNGQGALTVSNVLFRACTP
jgi:hypothetical protein